MAGLAPLFMSSRTYSAMASNGLRKVAVETQCETFPDLLDVDRCHVLQDSRPEGVSLVGHRAVLHCPMEHHHVASLALDLDHVSVEIGLIIRVLGDVVGIWPKRRPSIVFGEVCEEGDKLHRQRGRRVHDVRVCRGIKCPETGTGYEILDNYQHQFLETG